MAKTSFFQGQNSYQSIDPDAIKGYRDQAQEAAEASEVSAVSSQQSANNAAASETNALASRNAAASSATNAAASALASQGSASAAEGSKNQAATSASSASASSSAALNARNEAVNSASAALVSEGNAANHKTAAGVSEGNAATSAANALSSRNSAATSATNAATSETNANASKVAAASSASNASTSEANALTHRNAAASSATNAGTSETNANTSRLAAAGSATAAAVSATTAEGHKNAAATSEANAAASAASALASKNAAGTSETNAASSATAADGSKTAAATSATNAANSATTANNHRLAAGTSETNAASSASTALGHRNAAATSETNAGNSATAAASSASSALSSLNSFRETYYGAFATDPALDPLGGARTIGDLYYNTTIPALKVFNGTAWEVYNPLGASPSDAEYILKSAHSGLSASRVLTNTATVTWDFTTAGQVRATALTPNASLLAAKLDTSTAAKQQDFRTALQSASLEASAELGLLVNPFMEFSQENGTSPVGSGGYAADQYWTTFAGTGVSMYAQNIATPFSGTAGFRRLSNSVRGVCISGKGTFAASDYCLPFEQAVEGINWRHLGWGTADARAVDIVAIVSASIAGTYPLSIRNSAASRAYIHEVTLAANTPTVVFVTVPGETTGAWETGTNAGARISFGNVSGSTFHAPSSGAWTTGNFLSRPGLTNWLGTTNATVTMAYLQAFPSGVLPFTSASQITGEGLQKLLSIRRRIDTERSLCQRYFRMIGKALTGIWNSSSACRFATQLVPSMRVIPSVTLTTSSPTIEVWSSANVFGSGTYVSGTDKTDTHCLDVTLTGFSGAQGYRDPAFMTLDYLKVNARFN